MRFRELRRVVQSIVIAGLPACVGEVPAPGSNSCFVGHEQDFNVDVPAELPLQLRIESCRVDADACMDLCAMR